MARTHIVMGVTRMAYGLGNKASWIAARGTYAECSKYAKLLNTWIAAYGLDPDTCSRVSLAKYADLVGIFQARPASAGFDLSFTPQPGGILYVVQRLIDTPSSLSALLPDAIDTTIQVWTAKKQAMHAEIYREFPNDPNDADIAVDQGYDEDEEETR